jgi:type VI protein secretion system component Hcp
MIALQRSAGNASALALLRRAGDVGGAQAPITLTLPGVVDGATVSTWHIHRGTRAPVTDVELTRPTDSDSPRLARALTDGAAGATATLLVRKLTPLGWVRDMTVTFSDCSVSSFQTHGEFDSVWLQFTRMEVEQ